MKAAIISPIVFPLLSSRCRNGLTGKKTIVSELRILGAISTVYNIPVSSIIKRESKKMADTEPRQMAMLLMRMYTDLRVKQIGELFDKPYDHSTVVHGSETIQNDMQTNEVIMARFQKVQELLFNECTIKSV